MDIVALIGRIVFALMFVSSGLNHFRHTDAMAGYAKFKKVPAAKLSVQLSGLLMLLGGLSVITGIWIDLGAIVLAAMLVIMAVKMHDFWTVSDPQAKQPEMINFFKNISLAGGALFIFALTATEGSEFGPAWVGSLFAGS
jgi:putative oxidoreductase